MIRMNEELFMKAFGNETNLRILLTLKLMGQTTLYGIDKKSGLQHSKIRRNIEVLTALSIVNRSHVEHVNHSPGHKHRTRETVEYSLNMANPALSVLLRLLEEVPQ